MRFSALSCRRNVRRGSCSSRPAAGRCVLGLERLELRCLLSVFPVTTTADDGPGSLRQAIRDANDAADDAEIRFQISRTDANFLDIDSSRPGGDPDGDVFVISPKSALPALHNTRAPIIVNGLRQTLFQGDTNPLGPEIVLDGSLAGPNADGLRLFSGQNVVVGINIRAFSGHGILITGDGNVVAGCYVGTDATATTAMGNQSGIHLRNASENLVGVADAETAAEFAARLADVLELPGVMAAGAFPADHDAAVEQLQAMARNVISGNRGPGIYIDGVTARENLVQGNHLGTGVTGAEPLGNSAAGVFVREGQDNVIGGPEAAESNIIAFNGGAGVAVIRAASGNSIRGNAIYANAGLGIDLDGDGVSANDAGDSDSGANHLQNFPLLTSVAYGDFGRVIGTLESLPDSDYTIDLYVTAEADPSGYGEGRWLLRSIVVTTGELGRARFDLTLPEGIPVDHFVTATATDAAGNTSEFSPAVAEDHVGPVVTDFQPFFIKDVDGNVRGIEFVLTFDEELYAPRLIDGEPPPSRSANNPANYKLLALDTQTDVSQRITAVTYFPRSTDGPPAPRVVVEINPPGGLADGTYELTFLSSQVTDRAGNYFLTEEVSSTIPFTTRPPGVVVQADGLRASAVIAPGKVVPDLLLIKFDNVELNRDDAQNVSNYRLQRFDDDGRLHDVPLDRAAYGRAANRVLLATSNPLPPGNYRLTIFSEGDAAVPGTTGIAGRWGVPLDGDGDGSPGGLFVEDFFVDPDPNAYQRGESILAGNFKSLDALLQELLPAVQHSRNVLTAEWFAQRLLDELRETILAEQGLAEQGNDSRDIAEAVNGRLEEVFRQLRDAQYQLLDALPGEFVIVWGNSVRFLFSDPAASDGPKAVGFGLGGNRVEQIAGAVLVDDGNGPGGLSLAIVPLLPTAQLAGSDLVALPNGEYVLPNVTFELQWQGLAATNQAGIVALGTGGQTSSIELADAPADSRQRKVDLSHALDGWDPLWETINRKVMEGIARLVGPLEQLGDDLLVLWFDPIDFTLADARGHSGTNTGSSWSGGFAGAYFGSNGFTELLVIPGASSGMYTLRLAGLGGAYSGAINFIHGGSVTTVPLQGHFTGTQNLTAMIDFRQSTGPGPDNLLAIVFGSSPSASPTAGATGSFTLAGINSTRSGTLGSLGMALAGFDAFGSLIDSGAGEKPQEEDEQEDDDDEEENPEREAPDEQPQEDGPNGDDPAEPEAEDDTPEGGNLDGDPDGESDDDSAGDVDRDAAVDAVMRSMHPAPHPAAVRRIMADASTSCGHRCGATLAAGTLLLVRVGDNRATDHVLRCGGLRATPWGTAGDRRRLPAKLPKGEVRHVSPA